MEGISGYSHPGPNGDVIVDIESMTVDLITVLKAGGIPKEEAFKEFERIWRDVTVEVSVPKNLKN